jgi:SAM-dependent methyltransferase/uncharacterized protein YbaR (Trm112 family)
MYRRLLDLLRCPHCGTPFEVHALGPEAAGGEIEAGLLRCAGGHWYPVAGGIPRLLPDALDEHWAALAPLVEASPSPALADLRSRAAKGTAAAYDRQTRANFSSEWDYHEVGDKTWGMALDDRVRWFFLDPLGIPQDQLAGKVVLDAGCGNGSQSVAYTAFGTEVVAVDISSGLERGHAYRHRHPGARPDRVHFVQADLQAPPLAPASVDVIHSSGVLHHTPSTERTFRGLVPLLKPGGTFYTWLYKREPVVTPVVNGIRRVTTRLPSPVFARVAGVMAPAFMGFCWAVDRLGIRKYPPLARREAALALLDIFGAPYAHYHSYPEVARWYASEGFVEVWPCNDDRRGFGACGRLAPAGERPQAAPAAEVAGPS